MDHPVGAAILGHLRVVNEQRAARAAAGDLAVRVEAVKRYQQRRFEHTYADLLDHPRYAGAARFFLEELYGPSDFTQRDAQFARVVPALVRLFPADVVDTVRTLSDLHALSERFDTDMGRRLSQPEVDAAAYAWAWRDGGDAAGRERQIALLLHVGEDLDRLTRRPLLRHSLRLMRAPARAAGMAALQTFLESGFETFRAMGGAETFLALIGERERGLANALFEGRPALGQLP